MNYITWFRGFVMLLSLIYLFYLIGGNLINLIISISVILLIIDYLKEKNRRKNKYNY